jgi:hypothetical protein
MNHKKENKFMSVVSKHKHILIDIFLFLGVIGAIIADSMTKISFSNKPISVDIILILLPAIITVISITLSLTKEKIFFGIERIRFNKLRGSWTYSFLWMILITIIMFAFYTVCFFFSWSITLLCLDAISVFYAVYFSLQEIPLLIQNDKVIQKVIRKAYSEIESKGKVKPAYEGRRAIMTDTIQNMIFSKDMGLKMTYLFFKRSEEDPILLKDLLSRENEFLFKAVEDVTILKSNPSGDYKKINISDIIDRGYDNLLDLFVFSADYNFAKIFKDEDVTYQLTRSLFCLHRLADALLLVDKQKNNANRILFELTCNINKEETKRVSYSFLNSMMASTLEFGDTWFAKYLRDYDFPFYIFSFDSVPIGYFYLIYCYYLSKICQNISKETKAKINLFVNSRSEGLNSDGSSWVKTAVFNIESANDKIILDSIKELISVYDSSNEGIFHVYTPTSRGVLTSSDNSTFSKGHLFDVWLEIILFSPYVYVRNDDLILILNSFGEKDKGILLERLSEKWIDINNSSIRSDAPFGFLSYLGISEKKDKEFANSDVIKTLCDFRTSNLQKIKEKQIHDNEIGDEKLEEYRKKLGDGFSNAISNYPLLNTKLDLSKEKEVCFSIRIDSDGIDGLIDLYIKQMPTSLSNVVRKEVLNRVKPNIESEGYDLTQDSMNKVVEFKPEYMTSNSSIQYIAPDDIRKYLEDNVKQVGDTYLPANLFWKKGGLSANFEYVPDQSKFRRFTQNEIDQVIDNQYKMVNGLYKFGEYSNSDVHSFLVTRDELSKYLSKSLFFSLIVFKYKVHIDDSEIFFINKKPKK